MASAARHRVSYVEEGHLRYYPDLLQGSEEWHAARCGLLTASEMKLIITAKTLKAAANDKERSHLYELLAQRITGYVEPAYVSDDMLRGQEDELSARIAYAKNFAPVTEMGFITNSKFGFIIGYSPDGLVGADGQLECKSRRQKYQVQTLVEFVSADTFDPDFAIQVQTGLIVSEREWCDLASYSGGLPMAVVRVFPDPVVQDAILEAATAFEARIAEKLKIYREVTATKADRLIPTERKEYNAGEITL